ncbi:MAG: ABC transporter permease [Anaerolineales bacterium]|nr:ABC transporter permease [Anaerolineales bacterium]
MMIILYRLRAIFAIALKRLWARRGTTVATAVGLTIAVALMMTVPLYADAVNFRLLEERLTAETSRPPFAYMFNYFGSWHGAVQWEAVQEADGYLMGAGSRALGLPILTAVHHFETDLYQIFPGSTASYDNEDLSLTTLQFATASDLASHITLIEGSFPTAVSDPAAPLDVAVTRILADELGWQVGESYVAYNHRLENGNQSFPIRISGIWEVANAADRYWHYNPTVFDDLMMVPEETFIQRIAPAIDDEVNLATWYFVLDGSRMGTEDVDRVLTAVRRVERRLQTVLPNATTSLSPGDELQSYRRAVGELSTLLAAFNIPTIGLVLAFIALMGGLVADQRRNEFAVLRSRGGTAVQLLSGALIEGLLLGTVAFILGTALALLLTQWMGNTRSFLDFSADTTLRVALTQSGLWAGLVAVALATLAQLLPSVANARHTIISYKLVQARTALAPWWQRTSLDLLLLAITLYGYYQLQGQGSLLVIEEGRNAFQNPLLFLLPALAIISITLVFLRLLPLAMRGLSWLLQQTDSVTLLQAVRYLARTPQHYATPLILLVLTVSFAVYTASLARTLDYQLYDQLFYRNGADINLFTSPNDPSQNVFGIASTNSSEFVFLPVSEYAGIDGVEAAARVGEYSATARVGQQNVGGTFMGIDPYDFFQTAYWRLDFSNYRLGSLMNALGSVPDGVLVPRQMLLEYGLRAGDIIRLMVRLGEGSVELNSQIVGTFDYFPTWYPDDGNLLFVGNLNTLFEQAGGEYPYRVWLDTNAVLNDGQFRRELNGRQLFNTTWREPQTAIHSGLIQPERQGLFGILSVGFLAATLLTVLGLFLYALFSYRRRFIELGVLRAVGLSPRHMTRLIAWELGLLILSGLVLGTTLGIGVSRIFVPYLQVGSEVQDLVPPFLVEIAWGAVSQVYILFGLLFVVALGVLVFIALRMKLFMAIKLGETV